MQAEEKSDEIAARGEDPVREVILDRGLLEITTISPRASVLEALSRMKEKNIGALISTEGSIVVGVISERDCARRVLLEGKDPGRTIVDSVMSKDVCSVTAHKKVSECIELLLRRRIRHVPVLFGQYLVGCVSLRNLLEYLYQVRPETGAADSGLRPRRTERQP